MNERVRELLKLAEERYPRHLAVAVPEVVLRQDALVKFAELIVKECALTAGLMEYQGRKNIGATILDSFGVEK